MKNTRLQALWPLLAAAILVGSPLVAQEAEKKQPWVPPVPEGLPEKWDWIQLTSHEWLKGEIVALYKDSLEFESDELDTLILDWDDIKRVRTAQRMEIRFLGNVDVKGRLWVEDDIIRVIPQDGPVQEFTRDDVISVTIGSPKEIDHWAMKVSLGANTRTGNTDVTELNLSARFLRRSVKSRLTIDYLGNYNETEGVLASNNHRASFGWDKFINQRFFWNPVFAEYFRDPFQNIAHRVTIGIGVGYQIIDGKKTEWSLSGGPGYQENRFDDVVPGDPQKETTPALVFASSSDIELTGWMDFITEYRIQITNEESGTFNHHMVIAFETELTSLLDFDIQWIWDRIQDPRQNSDGTFPVQDDFRTVIALGFDW